MKCGVRGGSVGKPCEFAAPQRCGFGGKNNQIRHEVRALEEDLHVEQRRSVETLLSEVHDRLKQALPAKVAG
jgi:hypothetical protein